MFQIHKCHISTCVLRRIQDPPRTFQQNSPKHRQCEKSSRFYSGSTHKVPIFASLRVVSQIIFTPAIFLGPLFTTFRKSRASPQGEWQSSETSLASQAHGSSHTKLWMITTSNRVQSTIQPHWCSFTTTSWSSRIVPFSCVTITLDGSLKKPRKTSEQTWRVLHEPKVTLCCQNGTVTVKLSTTFTAYVLYL